MTARAAALFAALLIAVSAWPQGALNPTPEQLAFEETLVKGVAEGEGLTTNYLVYVPQGYDASKPWPLIVFLHGAGERGEDGFKQARVGLGPAILAALGATAGASRVEWLTPPRCRGPTTGQADTALSLGRIRR